VIELLTRNAGWKILSLLVSVLLWFTYGHDPEVGAFVSAPVEYRGMPENLEIGSDLVESVSIDLRGPSEKVANFSAVKPPVTLDFSPVHSPGERTFQIDERNMDLPSGMRLMRVVPARIRLQFELRARRDVPVRPRFSGAAPRGYIMDRYEVEPKELTLVGPQSHVQTIEYAATDPIDLSSVVGESEFHVNAFVGDPHVRFEKPATISVKVSMGKTK
jgi:YbbR domain-containing protein